MLLGMTLVRMKKITVLYQNDSYFRHQYTLIKNPHVGWVIQLSDKPC